MFEFGLSNSAMMFSLMAPISSKFVGAAAFSGASWATATEGVSRTVSASTKSTVRDSPVSFTRFSLLSLFFLPPLLILSFRVLFFSLNSSFLFLLTGLLCRLSFLFFLQFALSLPLRCGDLGLGLRLFLFYPPAL